jgi:P pilus assembly chaperone PapD
MKARGKVFVRGIQLIAIYFFSTIGIIAQNPSDTMYTDMGVSISPSSMHLSIKPGNSESKEIRVKNDTKKKYQFQVGFNDFEMGTNGKPTMLKPEERKYGLSKWIAVSPSFFELDPGEEIKLKAIITIPDEEDAYVASWTILTIEQLAEKAPLDQTDVPKRISMGIIPTFGFGVYMYQNPPNVKINKLDVTNMAFIEKETAKSVKMTVKNSGDGISYCTSYLELTNLKTGEQKKLQVKKFTILPQYTREFSYELGSDILPGKYSAIGVVDYGNKEELVAAELEFEIK